MSADLTFDPAVDDLHLEIYLEPDHQLALEGFLRDSIRAQHPAQDIDVQLETLTRRFGGRMPVGDDDAAEGVGRIDGHERNGIQRRPPEKTVDPKHAPGILPGIIGAEEIHAAFTEDGLPFRVVDVFREFFACVLLGGEYLGRAARQHQGAGTQKPGGPEYGKKFHIFFHHQPTAVFRQYLFGRANYYNISGAVTIPRSYNWLILGLENGPNPLFKACLY